MATTKKPKFASKSKPAPAKAAGRARYFSKRNIRIAALVVIAILAGIVAYRMHVHEVYVNQQFAKDKARFAATQKDMAAAYAAITQSLGQPFDTNIGEGCSYISLKFQRGPLTCSRYYIFSYQLESKQGGKQIGQKVLNLISDKYGFNKFNTQYGKGKYNEQTGQYNSYFISDNSQSCELNHETYATEDYNAFGKASLHKSSTSKYMGYFYLSCGSGVTKPLYKVIN